MRLGMIYRLRDEADIIEDNLRYHRAQGVDFFVVADRGSTDGTIEILERYQQAGVLRLERVAEDGDSRRSSELGLTRLAIEMGADWVLHNDADGFWWPHAGNLREALEAVPEAYGLVIVPRSEFAARPGEGRFAERMTVREARFLRPPKTAHRAHERIKVRGPQPSEIWIGRGPSRQKRVVAGKPVLRTGAQHHEAERVELLISPEFTIGVLRFPIRSFAQYASQVETAFRRGELDESTEGREIREAYEEGRLEELYARLVLEDDAVRRGIEQGWLVQDTDLRDYLRAIPASIESSDAPPGGRAWPEDRRASALATLQRDAMYHLSRYMQTYAFRTHLHRRERDRRRLVERRMWRQVATLRSQDRHLKRIESSLWWRMRPRLPALGRRRRKRH